MSQSSFALAARARKVAALVEYFDASLVRLGRDPHRGAGEMARTLRDHFDGSSWATHARSAFQRKPSELTQAEVIAVYERRAAGWAARDAFVLYESNRSGRRAS